MFGESNPGRLSLLSARPAASALGAASLVALSGCQTHDAPAVQDWETHAPAPHALAAPPAPSSEEAPASSGSLVTVASATDTPPADLASMLLENGGLTEDQYERLTSTAPVPYGSPRPLCGSITIE